MQNTYKVLGQVNPATTTLTTLYTVPASTATIVSTLAVCNQGGSTTIRVAVRPAGAAIAAAHYIVYGSTLAANASLYLTLGISLATTDVISVYAGTSTVSFSAFGTEIL